MQIITDPAAEFRRRVLAEQPNPAPDLAAFLDGIDTLSADQCWKLFRAIANRPKAEVPTTDNK